MQKPTLTRRDMLSVLAAGSVQLRSQTPDSALMRLSASPVTLEVPGQPSLRLTQDSERHVDAYTIVRFAPAGPLSIQQVVTARSDDVVERSFEVYAERDAIFNLEIAYEFPTAGSFYSWRKEETAAVGLVQDTGEPDRTKMDAQLFPFAAAVTGQEMTGVLGDSPGFWENRSQQTIDPTRHRIALRTGDASAARRITAIWGDTSGYYRGEFDGWQHIRAGETRRFVTWVFRAQIRDLYDVRLAAHRALATGKGWNDSGLTAILRNNAYLQVRRNLLRDESRFILISGVNYGWKQWASDICMAGLGLDNLEILSEALRGLFWKRLDYEENAQYYLILSAIIARAGFRPDLALCRRCLEFMRDHEKDGAYIPPHSGSPNNGLGWKTYMDLFYYADGDSPVSNQGFHCGALLGARELGFGVSEKDFQESCRAYARSFNAQGGYFPTSVMRPEVFGGDALYGEAMTYAAFGAKCLPDDLVLRHCRYAISIQSKYGIRVVSKANGDLLDADQYGPGNPHGLPPEKAGAYVQGGSWFFCDAGTWLSGLVHGLDPALVDSLLTRRIETELTVSPSFSESIHTRTGQPHGNILYAANAVYLWLRKTIRSRLGQKGADPVTAAIDRYLRKRRADG